MLNKLLPTISTLQFYRYKKKLKKNLLLSLQKANFHDIICLKKKG
jgi:hypothetical protein